MAFAVGVFVYAAGSFALMRGHAADRSFRDLLREFVRESWLALWSQPLTPLFYLVGYRMDRLVLGGARRALGDAGVPVVPVVFVHGYMQNRVGFVGLARALGRAGFGPLYGFNYPWFQRIESNAARLERFCAEVCKETKSEKVDLVCHSMGGLVAMEMMRDEAKHASLLVRRCVTIATPHAGVAWKGPLVGAGAARMRRGSKLLETYAGVKLAVPWLSIFSSHDNVVHPKTTSALSTRGGKDLEVSGLAHFSILFSPQVADAVATFLRESPPAPPPQTASTDPAASPNEADVGQ